MRTGPSSPPVPSSLRKVRVPTMVTWFVAPAFTADVMSKENGWQLVALVTSAFHMTRTHAVFAKAGVPVLPVPCNYESAPLRGRPLRWIGVPNATHLLHFECWLHEIVGWYAYRLRGWI